MSWPLRRGLSTSALPRIVKLYAGPGPNPEIAKLALAQKGYDVKAMTRKLGMTKAGPENRQAEFVALNPAGTTPFIELEDGFVLSESIAIARYADALHPELPALLGGPTAREAAQVDMWQKRVESQIVASWQRQFQYGEGLPYFKHFVPWAEASEPSVPGEPSRQAASPWLPRGALWAAFATGSGARAHALAGLRKMVRDNLEWLEGCMQARASAGEDTGFLAGTEHYSVADLQLIRTADFLSTKANTVAG